MIFKLQDRVAGITTAALIWAVCAMGIIIGLGGYLTSIVLTAGLVGALVLIERVENLQVFRSVVASRKRAFQKRVQSDRRATDDEEQGAA